MAPALCRSMWQWIVAAGLALCVTPSARAQADAAAPAAAAPPPPAAAVAPAPAPSSSADARTKVLLLDLASTGLDAQAVKIIGSIIAVELDHYRELDVLTGDDIRRTMELEVTRQSAGCDTESCLAELAGALGADFVIYGDAGALGSLVVVNLSLFDTATVRSLGRASVRAGSLEALPDAIRPSLRSLLARWYEARGMTMPAAEVEVAPAEAAGPEVAALLPWVVVGAGALAAVVGGGAAGFGSVPWLTFHDRAARLEELAQQGATTIGEARAVHEEQERARAEWGAWGAPLVVGGLTVGVLGAVAAAGGVAWTLLASPTSTPGEGRP